MAEKFIHAVYDDDDKLLDAIKNLKKNKIMIEEVFTPFPVHGLDHLLDLKPTRIAIAAFIYGCIGFTFGVLMINYIMIVDWPQNIGGKPSFSLLENLPAFVPVMFELTVFFTGHLMVITFYLRSRLWPFKEAENPIPETTDDKFLIQIPIYGNESKIKSIIKTTDFYDLTLRYVSGNGSLVSGQYYSLGFYTGAQDKNFTFSQDSAATTWTVAHYLNKFPSVTVKLSNGQIGQACVTHQDKNNLTIEFSGANSGTAYLN